VSSLRSWRRQAATRFSKRNAQASTLEGRSSSDASNICARATLSWSTKIDRLARSTSDLYRIVSELAEKEVAFKVTDDPTIDTTSRTGKLVMGILALIAEFENDIRRERQMDGITKARDRGVKFGRKPQLLPNLVKEIQSLRAEGITVPQIMRQTKLSRASIYRALDRSDQKQD
jgi:DNA invertase Pin-like site-specific DNA recombinase